MEEKTDKNPKRPRDPLEENISASTELEAVLKRRRLAAGGVENHNPEQRALRSPARSRRLESEVKPDTPAIASVRLRVQQFTQRRDVGATLVQRCMSDPGTESPSSTLLQDVCHIGEGEFSSRVERFKAPTPESSPIPTTPSTRQLSSFVHNMQQQLNTTMTPSTKEVSRIRQARDDELKSLRVKPLTENMWLKRSFSDPSLTEDDQEPECSLNFSGMNEMTGDSFSGSSTFTAETQPSATELCPPESVASPHEGMSTSALIDKMFEDVLQAADREEEEEQEEEEQEEEEQEEKEQEEKEQEEKEQEEKEQEEEEQEEEEQEEEEQGNDRLVSESKEDTNVETAETESKVKSPKPSFGGDEEQKECKNSNEKEVTGDIEESAVCNEEDFLSLPPSCVLSPLSKSVEAVVTPMRLTTTVPPPMVPCVPAEDVATPPAPPLYSIDAYRSQRKIPPPPPPSSQSVTPGVQKQCAEQSDVKPAINTKETIKAHSEDVSKLQTIINQTLQALSCCSDEEHGKGSLQEAEAEKLLLVSSEKHAALLAEISRLREGGAGTQPVSHPDHLQPCRGTISINDIQLPLKVEFVCSAHTARPTHYFFILIRYGACNIVATPLATAADAENGDTIAFSTSITLQDIRANFEIDVEVYSLCNSSSSSSSANVQQQPRSSNRSKATPRKILSSIKKSNPSSISGASSSLDPRRSSSFSLVGSHKITLSSLGQSKFPLDKMKFEGKIRRLLGDEFQEKVPFLSPLEGHIYLRLHSESHSNVQHQGFLTMFEDVSGFGAWQRLFFKLEGVILYYWNHPSEMGNKPAEGSISLGGFDSVRPVERDSCARPHTFELVNSRTMQQDHSPTLTKSWFSADTREERADWMEKLNQVLLDLHTWSRQSDRAETSSITATSRESFL